MRFMPSFSRKDTAPGPTLPEIDDAAKRLRGRIVETPFVPLGHSRFHDRLPAGAHVRMKLELFQTAGSFKTRGVLLTLDGMSKAEREAGVVAFSGGNHGLAVATAAEAMEVAATIVMPQATDPARVEGCRARGATVELVPDIAAALARMEEIAAGGATAIHPFEGEGMVLGAATCGYEMICNTPTLDAVIVPVGGGGLIGGISRAVKLFSPECTVIGVEPVGADSLTRSIDAGAPQVLERVDTIADSLGAPRAMPMSYGVAAAHVDRMVLIEDDAMRDGMRLLFDAMKLIAEPACAAALAALIGPLREELAGKSVGIIACGSNISLERFSTLTQELR
ncbi:MAG: pyridoxal-phosphate dependent enzyme [Pseudomonadota bacterium]